MKYPKEYKKKTLVEINRTIGKEFFYIKEYKKGVINNMIKEIPFTKILFVKRMLFNIFNIKYTNNNLQLSKYYFKNVWWPKSINNKLQLHKIFTRNVHKRSNSN